MSELAAKLNKRRSIVEEDGLHFESTPQEGQAPSSTATPSSREAPKLPQAHRLSAGNGEDLLSALNRRRATVDGDGETFESNPVAKVADAAATSSTAVPRPAATGAHPAAPGRRSGVNFREVIDQQRASVDGGGQHFESTPQAKTATFGTNKPSPKLAAAVESPAAAAAEPPAVAQEEPLKEQAVEKESAAKEAEAQAAVSVPTPSRAVPPQSQEEAPAAAEPEAAEERQASEEEHVEEEEEEAEEEHEADHEAVEADSKGTIAVRKDRILWTVGLRAKTLPDVFESEPFSIGSYGPVTLQLRADHAAGGIVLSLHGAAPRPAGLRVGLFAGKGWAKRSTSAWPDGADFEERFNVSFEGRSSLLCGLVHHEGHSR